MLHNIFEDTFVLFQWNWCLNYWKYYLTELLIFKCLHSDDFSLLVLKTRVKYWADLTGKKGAQNKHYCSLLPLKLKLFPTTLGEELIIKNYTIFCSFLFHICTLLFCVPDMPIFSFTPHSINHWKWQGLNWWIWNNVFRILLLLPKKTIEQYE